MNAVAEAIPVSTPRWRTVLLLYALIGAVMMIGTNERRSAERAIAQQPPTPTRSDRPAAVVSDTVQAHSTDVWPFRLTGLMHARITVRSDQPSDLRCRLIDPDGKQVKLTQAFRDECRFAWTPLRTGAYRMEVRNTSGQSVGYTVVVR